MARSITHAGLSSGGDGGVSKAAGCGINGGAGLMDPAGERPGMGSAPKSESNPNGSPSVGAPNIARSGEEAVAVPDAAPPTDDCIGGSVGP
eukprot:COSAG02_NODE_314_length_24915_cov_18.575596_7_plen_91_part_00